MKSAELRQRFLDFFEKKGHKVVSSSSLITDDPSVLFTTAGMQQFKPYFLEEKSPFGSRAASVQKCLRTSDIEEVGDVSHLTFFEMLGNFSFNDYFKKETIEWAIEFLTKELGLKKDKLWFTYFRGEGRIEEDKEAKEILKKLNIPDKRIFGFKKEDNFWGPTGNEGPCGPTVEIHYELSENDCSKNCAPNCKCGRFVEIWNLVFNQYFQDQDHKLTPLKHKGIDTGLGLERLAVVCQNKENIFETDLFKSLVEKIAGPNDFSSRVLADHIKALVFLTAEDILPDKAGQGYIVRRLLRKAIRERKKIKAKDSLLIDLAKEVVEIYKEVYPELYRKEDQILTVIQKEEEVFGRALDRGIKEFNKLIESGPEVLDGREAFKLYESYSLPPEFIKEMAEKRGIKLDAEGFKRAQKEHQKISRAGAEKKFGGLGKDKNDPRAVKLHTATHLLHGALRKILGEEVKQMGSNINPERLRFDFSFDRKLTKEELEKIEELVNRQIKKDLEVKKEQMPLKKAFQTGALAFFKEKYPEKVFVYSIGDFSKEICAGPHVEKTGQLSGFKILKQESVGAGVRRIKAILEDN